MRRTHCRGLLGLVALALVLLMGVGVAVGGAAGNEDGTIDLEAMDAFLSGLSADMMVRLNHMLDEKAEAHWSNDYHHALFDGDACFSAPILMRFQNSLYTRLGDIRFVETIKQNTNSHKEVVDVWHHYPDSSGTKYNTITVRCVDNEDGTYQLQTMTLEGISDGTQDIFDGILFRNSICQYAVHMAHAAWRSISNEPEAVYAIEMNLQRGLTSFGPNRIISSFLVGEEGGRYSQMKGAIFTVEGTLIDGKIRETTTIYFKVE